MSVPWPTGAPQFAESWQEKGNPNTVRTSMDIGPPKVRRRATRITRQITVSFTGTHDQWLAIRTFFNLDCQEGVEFHTFLHPYEGTVQAFRFMEAPQVTNVSSLGTTVTCVWEQI